MVSNHCHSRLSAQTLNYPKPWIIPPHCYLLLIPPSLLTALPSPQTPYPLHLPIPPLSSSSPHPSSPHRYLLRRLYPPHLHQSLASLPKALCQQPRSGGLSVGDDNGSLLLLFGLERIEIICLVSTGIN